MAIGSRKRTPVVVTTKPTFMERVTGRPRRSTAGVRTTSNNPFSSKPAGTTTTTRKSGGLFSSNRTGGRSKRSVATGPAPMSHHANANATTGDKVHGAGRKALGAITGDPRKEASGDAMMHGGANPNTGLGKTGLGRTSGGRTGGGIFGRRSHKSRVSAAY
jgi:hypothetical protein